MKRFYLIIFGMTLALPAMASSWICKKSSDVAGTGFQANISESAAELLENGQKIADLELLPRLSIVTPNLSVNYFAEWTLTPPRALSITMSDFSAVPTVILYQGGVIGYVPVELLNTCELQRRETPQEPKVNLKLRN